MVATEADTRATNLPEGADRSLIFFRGPCARQSRKSEEMRSGPTETIASARGTNPLKAAATGVGVERMQSPQARMRKTPQSSTGVRLLDQLRSCSVAGSGKNKRKSAVSLALPLRYSRVQSNAARKSSCRWTRALSSRTLPILSRALWPDNLRNVVPHKYARSRWVAHTAQPASRSNGVQWAPLGFEGIVAGIRNGLFRAARLFLFARDTKTVDATVTVPVEEAGAVGYSVLVRKDQNWHGSELGEDRVNDNFHGRHKDELHTLSDTGGRRADPIKQNGQDIISTPPISART